MITRIDTFLAMNPQAPGFSSKNQHFYMSGVNPTYYLDTTLVQEQQIAPLAASVAWSKSGQTNPFALSVCKMTPGISSAYDAYAIGSDSAIYGINASTIIASSFGFPSGSSSVSGDHRITCFANQIIASVANIGGSGMAELYRLGLTGGSTAGIASLIGTIHELEPFSDYCLVATCPTIPATSIQAGQTYTIVSVGSSNFTAIGASSNTPGLAFVATGSGSGSGVVSPGTQNFTSQVQRLTTAFILESGIDFGVGWNVQKIRNYNDKYAAIAVTQNNFSQSYVALWDGISGFASAKIKVPGRLLDMKVVDGVLKIAVWLNGGSGSKIRTAIYYLDNLTFKLDFSPVVSYLNVPTNNQDVLCNFSGKLGAILGSTDFLTSGSRDVGLERFVLSTGLAFDHFCEAGNGYVIGTVFNGTGTDLYAYQQSSLFYNQINYISQWIPTNGATAIKIYYDTPPQSGTDAINTTIYGRGEDISTAGASSTTQLEPINVATIADTGTQISQYATTLDLKGFTGSLIKVQIQTVNSSWRPIIRGYELIDSIITKGK